MRLEQYHIDLMLKSIVILVIYLAVTCYVFSTDLITLIRRKFSDKYKRDVTNYDIFVLISQMFLSRFILMLLCVIVYQIMIRVLNIPPPDYSSILSVIKHGIIGSGPAIFKYSVEDHFEIVILWIVATIIFSYISHCIYGLIDKPSKKSIILTNYEKDKEIETLVNPE